MLTKRELTLISIIIALLVFIARPYFMPVEVDNLEEISVSKGKIKIYQQEIDSLIKSGEILEAQRDSLIKSTEKQVSERKDTKQKFDEKKNDIVNLPLDGSILYCSRWLSEADTLK